MKLPSHLLLIGDSPIINALKQFAPILDFKTTHLDQSDLSQIEIDEHTYILIATHGRYDEDMLAQALTRRCAYIGMVGSPRRAEPVVITYEHLAWRNRPITRLKAPTGLNIGAVTPEEIAASIVAELIEVRRRPPAVDTDSGEANKQATTTNTADTASPAVAATETTAIDPVCGMIVEIANARHQSWYDGQPFYFCCPACKRQFGREPQQYLVANER